MKTHVAFLLLCLLFARGLFAQISVTTDVPRIMNYQGQITSADGRAVNGSHRIIASLYSDPDGSKSVWQGQYDDTKISGGLFSVFLGSGSSQLPANVMNQPLWVGIRIDDGEELRPLAQLAAAPYALSVPDKSITFEKLSDDVLLKMQASHIPTPQGNTAWSAEGNEISTENAVLGTRSTSLQKNWETRVAGKPMWHFEDAAIPNIRADGDSKISGKANIILGIEGSGKIFSSYCGILTGVDHQINTNSDYSQILGGFNHQILDSSEYSVVTGGNNCGIGRNAPNSFIGGGAGNWSLATNGTVGGGYLNRVWSGSDYSFVGGGFWNWTYAAQCVISGGKQNRIEAGSNSSAITGGDNNAILLNSEHSFIGGGKANTDSAAFGVIGGGEINSVSADAHHSFIGSGLNNKIKSIYGVIAGGNSNLIDGGKNPSRYNFIGGGSSNIVGPGCDFNVLCGGKSNQNGGAYSFIGGGSAQRIGENCTYNVIAGGAQNFIGDLARSKGAQIRFATIAGGSVNKAGANWSTIGGGQNNIIQTNSSDAGQYATIPGGRQLVAGSYGQTVIGVFNKPQGTSNEGNFQSVTGRRADDRMFIIGNGIGSSSRHNAFEVSNNGHSIVFDNNRSGGATPDGGNASQGSGRPAIKGATYDDNIVYAWGDISPDDNSANHVFVGSDFGVTSVAQIHPGIFKIVVNIVNPYTNLPEVLTDASITVTVVDDDSTYSPESAIITSAVPPTNGAGFATVSHMGYGGDNTFFVRTYERRSYSKTTSPKPFMFKVCGRRKDW